MLRIRLTRTGKNQQPSYRIVVAEHSAPIDSKFIEVLGYYLITRKPRTLEVNQDRVIYWISKGAKPSDTVACLLKSIGMTGMEKYIAPRNLKRKKKKEGASSPASAAVSEAPAGNAPASEPSAPAEPAPPSA